MLSIDWLEAQFPDLSNIQQIGKGGQKLVFSAQHSVSGPVVLKIINQGTSQVEVDREILAIERVNSGRVPQILTSDTLVTPFGSAIWLLEEHISGKTLHDYIYNVGSLSPQQVLVLANDILEALCAAEEVQIVHRDVKPDNIIIDNGGRFWLLDFGIARHLTMESLTATASMFGKFTPGYAPVEQLYNQKSNIDGRTDLHALGVTIFEAATGTNPFLDGVSGMLEIFERTKSLSLPRLRLAINGAESFADLVEAMTKTRRDHRCDNVLEAKNWLNEILALQN